ncbi:H-NS histone family protein [Caballeronia arationis]|uniref:H-NS histone family protein n=1 Tax=Caballeronia arationis TaxID=1777142 RepID=A0A7Z7I3F3_9BURK|nr:H-NS family nucleoid-associated regulatory protein [Caballeronia arationis]SAK46695.1 H-NS histone family protein [Caballeronia arationis]SOE58777.1 H-NS histone family protein [Caballeronia arationis]
MDERKRDSIIAYLRGRMVEFGITETALAEALAEANVAATPLPPKTNGTKRPMPQLPSVPHAGNGAKPAFMNASGDTWDGIGDMPEWLKRAVHAGQDIEFYRV